MNRIKTSLFNFQFQKKMYKIAVVSIFLLGSTFGSPVPQVEDKEGKVKT